MVHTISYFVEFKLDEEKQNITLFVIFLSRTSIDGGGQELCKTYINKLQEKLVRRIFTTSNLVTQPLNGELENQCGALDWPTMVLTSVGLLLRIDLAMNQGSQQVVDCMYTRWVKNDCRTIQ